MGTGRYNALTSRGIVLVSVSPSQNALNDPSFELFGEPENPESIDRSIGAIDSSEVNAIAYDLGEVVREAMVPAAILESSDASTVLGELQAISTLTDVMLIAGDSKGALSKRWVDWLISLDRLTGLTLVNFTDVCALEHRAGDLQSLVRLNIGFSCFSAESLFAFSQMKCLSYLYLSGVMTEELPFIPFKSPSVSGLIYNIRSSSIEPKFVADCYPSLRCLRIDTSEAIYMHLKNSLPTCRVFLEKG